MSCDVCEQVSYCTAACLKKDKRFHTKQCVPIDKIEVISNSSNLVIEMRKRDLKAEEKESDKF